MSSGSQSTVFSDSRLPTPESRPAEGSSGPAASTPASARAARLISTHAETPSSRTCPRSARRRSNSIIPSCPEVGSGTVIPVTRSRNAKSAWCVRRATPSQFATASWPAASSRPQVRAAANRQSFATACRRQLLERFGLGLQREVVARAFGSPLPATELSSPSSVESCTSSLVGRVVLEPSSPSSSFGLPMSSHPDGSSHASFAFASSSSKNRRTSAARAAAGTTSADATERTHRSQSASNDADGSSSGTSSPSESHVMSSAIAARYSCRAINGSMTWANAAGLVKPSRWSRQNATSFDAGGRFAQAVRAEATCAPRRPARSRRRAACR